MKTLIVICMLTNMILALDSNYIGCYRNPKYILLKDRKFIRQQSMSARKCVNLCGPGFQYAGTEFSYKCFCGNDTTGILTQHAQGKFQLNKSKCDYLCNGEKSEMCGGNFRISIYKIWHDKKETGTTARLPTSLSVDPLYQDLTTKSYKHTTDGFASLNNVSINSGTIFGKTTTENIMKASKNITNSVQPVMSNTKRDGTISPPSNHSCPCCNSPPSKRTKEEIEIMLADKIKEIKKELTINKSALSSFKRRKTCARDDRRSAAVLGWIGILTIALVLSCLILPDILRICKYVRQ